MGTHERGVAARARTRTASRKRRPKPKRRLPPEVLTPEEARAILDACGCAAPIALRNRALIALMYRAGLRVSEALGLHPKDVDLAAGVVRVLRGKGGFDRTVGLDPGACAIVARWAACRERRGLGPHQPLVSTLNGGYVTDAYVRRLMPMLGKRAGIAKRVHAHGLRHTHAAELRSEGVDVGIISKQLGHRSLMTTIRYLDHVAPVRVIEAVRSRVW